MTAQRPRSRETALVAVAVLALCLCMLILGMRSLSAARSELSAAAGAHAKTVSLARRLETLSGQRAALSDQPRPEPDLVARIGAQMTVAGLDPSQVTRVQVSAVQPVGDGTLRRQSANVGMTLATPADLARWLRAWSEAEPAWTVTGLRLDHAARSTGPPLAVSLALESLHRADQSASRATSSSEARP